MVTCLRNRQLHLSTRSDQSPRSRPGLSQSWSPGRCSAAPTPVPTRLCEGPLPASAGRWPPSGHFQHNAPGIPWKQKPHRVTPLLRTLMPSGGLRGATGGRGPCSLSPSSPSPVSPTPTPSPRSHRPPPAPGRELGKLPYRAPEPVTGHSSRSGLPKCHFPGGSPPTLLYSPSGTCFSPPSHVATCSVCSLHKNKCFLRAEETFSCPFPRDGAWQVEGVS